MFQFSAFPTLTGRWEINPIRFPYLGNLRIKAHLAAPRSFSQLCHDLLRLWTPRHPPYTLRSLTYALSCIVVAALFAYVLIHLVFKERQHRLEANTTCISSRGSLSAPCHSFGVPSKDAHPTNGGGDRIRTDDPLVANQVLYQLSYAPFCPLATDTIVSFAREENGGPDKSRTCDLSLIRRTL